MSAPGITQVIGFVKRDGYLLLFLWVLAEQGALPIPSVPLLIAVGAVIREGSLNLWVALASCLAGALIADSVWFELGKRRGKKVLRFLCRISLEPDSCVKQTENVFIRYGLKTLLIAKFLPGLNAVAAPLAGDSGISTRVFLAADAAGILLWSGTFTGLGYLFSDQLGDVLNYAQQMGSGVLLLILSLFAGWIVWRVVQRQRFLHQLKGARITPEELSERIDAGHDLYIVDLRSQAEHEAMAVPGSVRFSMDQIQSNAQVVPRDREVILFCNCPNEASSAKMAILLRAKGVTRVRPLQGGADAWEKMMQLRAAV